MDWLLHVLLFGPALAGLICLIPALRPATARGIALGVSVLAFLISLLLCAGYGVMYGFEGVRYVTALPWIELINAEYRVGIDGLSLPLIILTTGLSILVVGASWRIEKAVKTYFCLYLMLLSGMLGVFLALDMFLFYVFFELSLVPMYFLIGLWGGPRKEYAAIKFFLYTLVGSVCLLVAMLGLYFYTPAATGGAGNTFLMVANEGEISLISPEIRSIFARGGPYWGFAQAAFWLTLIAFLIKLPAAPLHTWLPDAHVEAPTPISMVLAGVLLKMGGYAMMRVSFPMFPDAAMTFAPIVGGIGVFGILYGALCALAQTDWKRLVAYSSVSHMGFVTLGLAAATPAALSGAYFQMISHGITSAMMFFLVGVVYERAHHRDINALGGLWNHWPAYGAWSLIGFFAGMGLPGLCGFVGEIMVLLGTFAAADSTPWMTPAAAYSLGIFAALGVVLSAAYILWMFQRIYLGKAPETHYRTYEPISGREQAIMVSLGVLAIVLGVVPALVFSMTGPTMKVLAEILTGGPVGALAGAAP